MSNLFTIKKNILLRLTGWNFSYIDRSKSILMMKVSLLTGLISNTFKLLSWLFSFSAEKYLSRSSQMIQKSKKGFMMNFVVKFNEMIAFISSEHDKDIGKFGLYLGKYSKRGWLNEKLKPYYVEVLLLHTCITCIRWRGSARDWHQCGHTWLSTHL